MQIYYEIKLSYDQNINTYECYGKFQEYESVRNLLKAKEKFMSEEDICIELTKDNWPKIDSSDINYPDRVYLYLNKYGESQFFGIKQISEDNEVENGREIIKNLTRIGFTNIEVEEYLDNAVLFTVADPMTSQIYMKIAVTKKNKLYVYGITSIKNESKSYEN